MSGEISHLDLASIALAVRASPLTVRTAVSSGQIITGTLCGRQPGHRFAVHVISRAIRCQETKHFYHQSKLIDAQQNAVLDRARAR